MTPLQARFRELFLAAVEATPDAPLMLSGGVDSATVLAASLELGRKPFCVTFRLGDRDSEDAAVARKMTAAVGVEAEVVTIPRTPETLVADVRRVLAAGCKPLKTHVQCSQAFLYLCPAVRRRGADSALYAILADEYWGTDREAAFALRRSRAEFDAHRSGLVSDSSTSTYSIEQVAAVEGVALHTPWRNPALGEFMMGLSFEEMNRPRQKYLCLAAFPDFWKRGAWYRRNGPFQIVAGIREWHAAVLGELYPGLAVTAAYRRIGAGE